MHFLGNVELEHDKADLEAGRVTQIGKSIKKQQSHISFRETYNGKRSQSREKDDSRLLKLD